MLAVTEGSAGGGVRKVVHACPTRCDMVSRLHVTGVLCTLFAPRGLYRALYWTMGSRTRVWASRPPSSTGPGVGILALLFNGLGCKFQCPKAGPVTVAAICLVHSVASPAV